jgi:hypothetical protein
MLWPRPEGIPRRRRKAVVPMDTSLFRCSARLERINKGFNPNMAAATDSAASSSQTSKNKGKAVMTADGPTYEGHSVPGVAPVLHLSVSNVQQLVLASAGCSLVFYQLLLSKLHSMTIWISNYVLASEGCTWSAACL